MMYRVAVQTVAHGLKWKEDVNAGATDPMVVSNVVLSEFRHFHEVPKLVLHARARLGLCPNKTRHRLCAVLLLQWPFARAATG